jgi:hypothetical protein
LITDDVLTDRGPPEGTTGATRAEQRDRIAGDRARPLVSCTEMPRADA